MVHTYAAVHCVPWRNAERAIPRRGCRQLAVLLLSLAFLPRVAVGLLGSADRASGDLASASSTSTPIEPARSRVATQSWRSLGLLRRIHLLSHATPRNQPSSPPAGPSVLRPSPSLVCACAAAAIAVGNTDAAWETVGKAHAEPYASTCPRDITARRPAKRTRSRGGLVRCDEWSFGFQAFSPAVRGCCVA